MRHLFSVSIFIFSIFANAKIRIPCSLSLFEDHKVQAGIEVLPVFPGAGYISAAIGVLQMLNPGKVVLERGRISKPLIMSESTDFITVVATEKNILISSDQAPDKKGHFSAKAHFEELSRPINSLISISDKATEIDVKQLYEDLNKVGLKYGPNFQGVKSAKIYRSRVDGTLSLAEDLKGKGYPIHPAIIDSAFHLVAALARKNSDKIFVPALFNKIQYYGKPTNTTFATVVIERLPTSQSTMIQADITLYNDQKQLVLEMEDVVFAAAVFSGG